jgi:hypothetical protein
MRLQLNTDHHLRGSEALARRMQSDVSSALERFAPRITRVEMHLNAVNGDRAGPDKRCQLEARIAGRAPVSVHHVAPSVPLAVDGALKRLVHALGHALGKLDAGTRCETLRGRGVPSDAANGPPGDVDTDGS